MCFSWQCIGGRLLSLFTADILHLLLIISQNEDGCKLKNMKAERIGYFYSGKKMLVYHYTYKILMLKLKEQKL